MTNHEQTHKDQHLLNTCRRLLNQPAKPGSWVHNIQITAANALLNGGFINAIEAAELADQETPE